ncbi:tRNA lysidine(34) synthetase TilS [Enterococcus faecalis]
MFWQFYKDGTQMKLWQKDQRLLLAVSGGVDSMVLLHLIAAVAQRESFTFAVAHVNHHLRKESDKEAAYLRSYCQKNAIPYFQGDWQPTTQRANIEARARAFRYGFFAEIMQTADYQVLMTAHHLDDQVETILMKLTRGTAFNNAGGIRRQQTFAGGILLRPLLEFSKESIRQYAQDQALVYFEDQTNHTAAFMRNRIRNQVVPLLKAENPRFLQHMSTFSYQQTLAAQFIEEQIRLKYKAWLKKNEAGYQFPLTLFQQESPAFQYFFLTFLLQELLVKGNNQVNQGQVQQILLLLRSEQPQGSVSLENNWRLLKRYETVVLQQVTEPKTVQKDYCLQLETGLFLSETEWLGFTADNSLKIPEQIAAWPEETLNLPVDIELPLLIRHRKAGDKIKLKQGLTKKLSRWFIDAKIPNDLRERAWVVTSATAEIIWLPGFVNSYLSIPEETDKIHYRLLFKTKE